MGRLNNGMPAPYITAQSTPKPSTELPMGYPRKFTPAIQTLFLKVLEETASPKKAAEVVGVSRELAYTYREKDLEFRRRWDAAIQVALDCLLEEGFRRAVVGVQEPVVYQGQVSTKVDASGQEHAVTI